MKKAVFGLRTLALELGTWSFAASVSRRNVETAKLKVPSSKTKDRILWINQIIELLRPILI